MLSKIRNYLEKPNLYDPGTGNFWDDEHISKGLLEAHLNPDWDAATRNHNFVDRSVKWIASIAPPKKYKYLLDLGCGPGIYAERFQKIGYSVTGIDFSKRSIEYARKQSQAGNSNINYIYQNYLTMDYVDQFELVTLIYCDYAPLSISDRLILLKKVYQALKPGGKFIFDVFTPKMRRTESRTWSYHPEGGFWSEKAHLCLESVYQYDDDDKTELTQTIVITEDNVHCYNIWDHYFSKEKLKSEIKPIGFKSIEFFGDVAGKEYSETGETICAVLTK